MRMWLVKKRNARKLSQKTMSSLAHISQQSLSSYESGLRTPSVQVAKRIAEILNFDWTKFFEEDSEESVQASQHK